MTELNIATLASTVQNCRKNTPPRALKKLPERKAKVSKQPLIEDKNNSISDDSEGDDEGWDYRTLTDAQKQLLPPSVLKKKGKLFVDR